MVKKYFFAGVLVLLSADLLFAQLEKKVDPRTFIGRFNITGLVDPVETNISLGGEYKLKNKLSLATDAGYVFHSNYFENNHGASGYIIRPAIRYHIGKYEHGFLETELHFKIVTYRQEDWVGRECVDGVASYEEYTHFRLRKSVYGFHLKAGYQDVLFRHTHWWFEVYGGLGFRWKQERVLGDPRACYRDTRFLTRNNMVNNFYTALPMGVRILHIFSRH